MLANARLTDDSIIAHLVPATGELKFDPEALVLLLAMHRAAKKEKKENDARLKQEQEDAQQQTSGKRRPKAKAESTPSSSVPKAAPKVKAAPKAKRAPKKPEPEEPEPVDRFQAFSNTDLIAGILARTEDRRMEQKRQLYRSFLS